MKKLVLFALVMALMTGFGCSKKTTTMEPIPDSSSAIRHIEDSKVFFDFDKFDIKSDYYGALKENADLMKKHPKIRVRIEGHCDERGTKEYNLALGALRALAVRDYLTILGVDENQISMVSYGKERPMFIGKGEAVWSKNRRDDFKVIAK